MPQQVGSSVENNFSKGLITEFTGLNFPENAATDTDNCQYDLVGNVKRRLGFNFEPNYTNLEADRTLHAMSTYVWNNPGGDSTARLLVKQVGHFLYFYNIAAATTTNPLSNQLLTATVAIDSFVVVGSSYNDTVECEYTDGNGYLFVFHPSCDPFYISYSAGVLTPGVITVQIRDLIGVDEGGLPVTSRPSILTNAHNYNLVNQGWTSGAPWSVGTVGTSPPVGTGPKSFTLTSSSSGPTNGQFVDIVTQNQQFVPGYGWLYAGAIVMQGTVTSYVGNILTINVTSTDPFVGASVGPFWIGPRGTGYLQTWNTAIGNYPSNADVWWYFKDSTGAFNPTATVNNVSLNSGNAPRGHYILDAFNQLRGAISGLSGISNITTTKRPTTGAWFQGRVWYAGVNANQAATSSSLFYSWSENIYFSQVVLTSRDFGNCYQINDPTSETLLDILPTDGGVINIAGSGRIYKLFPIANGLLVFASNGIWFITGSQGIGFAANDYTITKLSSVQSTSSTSFVDVMGLPFFWNEEGIYQVKPGQGGSLSVEPITVGTIQTFYNDIPFSSKVYARGAYNPVDFLIQWTYKSTPETSVTDRYNLDSILAFDTYNKAFYRYTIGTGTQTQYIHGINYITYPTIDEDTPSPGFKYHSSFLNTNYKHQFVEEWDTNYVDFGVANYISYFITGYRLRGKGITKSQLQYLQMYIDTNEGPTAYKIQGIWDYAGDPNTGRWSTNQYIDTGLNRFTNIFKRHKIRGQGYALQFRVSSVDGKPFNVIGWAAVDTINQGT